MPEGASPVYRFGPFAVDVADGSLKCDDVRIPLTPKLFDLLVTLVTNAGRLVEKETLLKSVWQCRPAGRKGDATEVGVAGRGG
jgi:DNA-binding winged helix-turn-helix (wHTH) protein